MTNDPIIQGGQGRSATSVQQDADCVLAVLIGGIGAMVAAEFVFAYIGTALFPLRSPLGG